MNGKLSFFFRLLLVLAAVDIAFGAVPVIPNATSPIGIVLIDPTTGTPYVATGISGIGTASDPNIIARMGFAIDFANVTNGTTMTGLVPANWTNGIGTTPVVVNGAGNATVTSGYAVPNGTNFYATFTAPTNITSLSIEFAISSGGSGVPIIAYGAQTSLAVNVLHLASSQTGFTLMVRVTGGADDIILTGTWDYPIIADGSTLSRIKMSSNGDTVVVYGPNGEVFSKTDPRIGAIAGTQAFFESSDTTVKIKRFYANDGLFSATPPPFGLASDLPVAPLLNTAGYEIFNPYTTGAIDNNPVSSGGAAALNFGPTVILGRVLASISIGASSFQCSQLLPNGTYDFDFFSASGANVESITVTSSSGTSSPYTINISGTFAKTHTADARGSPTLVISTGTIQQGKIIGWPGLNILSTNSDFYVGIGGSGGAGALGGRLIIGNGSDTFSNAFVRLGTNSLGLQDIGPGNPTRLTATGGFIAGSPTGGYEGTGSINAQSLYSQGTQILPVLSGTTGSIGGGALLAGACTSGTVAVTGATTSMVALADPNTYPGDGNIWDAQVTSSNTVTVKVCAIIAATPTASTYNVRVIQ